MPRSADKPHDASATGEVRPEVRTESLGFDLLECISDAIVKMSVEGVLEYVSGQITEILGWSPEEMVGMDGYANVHPDDVDGLRREAQVLLAEGRISTEYRLRHKQGHWVWVWTTSRLIPGRSPEEGPAGFLSVVRDVSAQKRDREELVRSRERLAEAERIGGSGCWRIDLTTREVWWSPNRYALFGWDPQTAPAPTVEAVEEKIAPQHRDRVRSAVRRAVKNRSSFDVDYETVPIDGQVRVIRARGEVRCDEQGNPVELVGIDQDLTEQRRSDQELMFSLQKYRQLFENVPYGLMLIDTQGRILEANPAASRLLGGMADLSETPHLSDPRWEVIRTDGTRMDPDDFPAMRALRERTVAESTACGLLQPDGTVAWVDVVAAPMDLAGYGVVVAFADVSERVEAEKAVREGEALLAETGRIAQVGGWKYEVARNALAWTDEMYQIHGLSPGRGVNLSKAVSMYVAEDRESLLEAMDRAIDEGRPYDLELRVRSGGQERWIRNLATVREESGKVVELVGACQDITQAKTARRELQASLHQKELLLRELHHRVKNNLQVVCSLLSLQARAVGEGPDAKAFDEIHDRVRSMALVHDMFFRSGRLEEVRFSHYLQELTAYLSHSHDALGRDIHLDIQAEEVPVSMDQAVPCGLIVNELVTNALHHAYQPGQSGRVSLSLRHSDPTTLVLEVADDGSGLPEQIDVATSSTLGLQLVDSLVRQLDGHLTVDRSGRGTRFAIEFPIRRVSR